MLLKFFPALPISYYRQWIKVFLSVTAVHDSLAEKWTMLTVTAIALEKLKETLLEHSTNPEVAIRVTLSPSMPKQLDLILDKERRGDKVVESREGTKVLFIQANLALKLEGLVLDYEEMLQDFVISTITRHWITPCATVYSCILSRWRYNWHPAITGSHLHS